ncbi:MAG: ribonuclease HI family protein [Solirubrobacterales bacterium]
MTGRLVINVDGGARGNPGPAAIGVVVRTPEGEVVDRLGELIGVATNNVAEYRALLRGIARGIELGGTELELIGDSELVVRQVRGEYKVKEPNLRLLRAEVVAALRHVPSWSICNVPREQNADADGLVNQALDAA